MCVPEKAQKYKQNATIIKRVAKKLFVVNEIVCEAKVTTEQTERYKLLRFGSDVVEV